MKAIDRRTFLVASMAATIFAGADSPSETVGYSYTAAVIYARRLLAEAEDQLAAEEKQ